MTQEDKELLLQDLCARLSYGVKLKIGEHSDYKLIGIIITDESPIKVEVVENDILSFLDTLEVKEVDLEKEIEKEWLNCDLCRENTILEYVNMDIKKFRTIVNHFFELGLKAQKGE